MTTDWDNPRMKSWPPEDLPAVGSEWYHHNGNRYRVILLSNLRPERQNKYPLTISYQNTKNNEVYSRKFSLWHRSMTLAT